MIIVKVTFEMKSDNNLSDERSVLDDDQARASPISGSSWDQATVQRLECIK